MFDIPTLLSGGLKVLYSILKGMFYLRKHL